MPAQLSCPNCQTTLNTNKVIPAGREVLCPKCKVLFKAPATGVNAAKMAMAGSTTSKGSANGDSSSSTRMTKAPAPTKTVPPPVQDEPSNQGVKVAAIVGGGVILLVVGIGLFAWAFSGPAENGKPEIDAVNKDKPIKPPDDDGKKGGDDAPPKPIVIGAGKQKQPDPVMNPPVQKGNLAPEEVKRIGDMKAKALAWFQGAQEKSGTWPNPRGDSFAGLGGLAMLECGVNSKSPSVQLAAANVRKALPRETEPYAICFSMLFLARLGDPADEDLIRVTTMRIIASQSPQGAWGYECATMKSEVAQQLSDFLKDLGDSSWDDYAKTKPDNAMKYDKFKKIACVQKANALPAGHFNTGAGGDNSHAQVGLLALWSVRKTPTDKTLKPADKALKLDMPVDRALKLTVRRFRDTQKDEGYWIYVPGNQGEPGAAMTCAGLLALAMGHAMDQENIPEKDRKPLKDEQITKALKYVGTMMKNNDPVKRKEKKETRERTLPMYSIWSVERVGVLFQVEKIEDVDWYRWGTQFLLDNQLPNGSFHFGDTGPAVDTSFALLFLEQANLVSSVSQVIKDLELGGIPNLIPAPPPKK